MLITFEGLDRSGKSTQAKLLVDKLAPEYHVHYIREPGGTPISERIRDILLNRSHPELHPIAELLLFSASRAQLVTETIAPALRQGAIVVCDRYYDSTTAYQGYGRGLNIDTIVRINAFATGGTVPDLTFFVDITVDEIERRRMAAGLSTDRMESAGREFYERVRRGYCALAKEHGERFVTINGMAPVEKVGQEVWEGFRKCQRNKRS
jgi:dTMP kinase